MPRVESSAGNAGADGILYGNESHFIVGVPEIPLVGDPDNAPWLPSPAQPEEPTEPDPAGSRFLGRSGRPGAAFVPSVRRMTESARLPGPSQFVVKLLEFWRLREGDAPRLLGFNREDAYHVALVLAGVERFRGRDVRERIGHLVRIRSILSALFRDRETENEWLRRPHSLLDDRVPMDLMLGGSVEDLSLVRDYVETAAGW